MKPLYLSPPVRRGLGPCLRPGGMKLTQRILDLLAPPAASLVLDAGCGTGASMDLLREYGVCRVMGFDIEPELACEARRQDLSVALADLARLPLADRCLDLILSECVWNLTDRHGTAGEFARVLRPGGYIALTDIYNRNGKKGDWPLPCCFSGASDLASVIRIFSEVGFTIEILEDHSPLLNQTAAEFVFAHGSLQNFWQAVTGDKGLASAACSAAAAGRPGLFLLIARRKEAS